MDVEQWLCSMGGLGQGQVRVIERSHLLRYLVGIVWRPRGIVMSRKL